ncbi:MAG: PDZ domain-containing protein, partial [Gemmatimonadaceae bacterium]
RLHNLPVNSREYSITDDSIRAAFRAIPGVPAGGSFTIRLEPRRAVLINPIDNIPQGWFGFLADGYNRLWDDPTGTIVQYFEYPTVVGVEANSPASRAGVRSGDSLVAYDGRDLLKHPVNLTTLQTPGRQVSVKLRRDGEGRDLVIAVEKAPSSVMVERRSAVMARTLAAMPRAQLMIDTVLDRHLVEARASNAVAVGARSGTVVTSAPTRAAAGGFGGGGNRIVATTVPALSGVLGAAMTNIDKEMSESLVGMKGRHGVLVTGVPNGSLADRTGLKALDVILRVGDSDVMTINHLRVRLAAAEDNRIEKVRLLILRAGKTQELYRDTTR